MTILEAEVIVYLANNQLNISEVARKLYLHRNSVVYHIKKIRKKTGLDPMDFHDMCKLYPEAKKLYE